MVTLLNRITEPTTSDASPTIRDTSVTVDQVHQELMIRTPQSLIQLKYSDLEEKDIQAVWVYKAVQNNQNGVIDLQELISSFNVLPKKVSLLQLYDHIDLMFQIQTGVAEGVEGKGTPHEQVMREFVTGLKMKKKLNDH